MKKNKLTIQNTPSDIFIKIDNINQINTSLTDEEKIKQHFSSMGKKSWAKRRKDILNS